MTQEDFKQAGFAVVDSDCNDNKLLSFVRENYPSVIKDNEVNLAELKAILGLPIDEKVNGYGLNFVGRNVARAKYAQKTDKELHLNTQMRKDMDSTQNLVLKGDNLDSLKILKNHYSGKIKCIYIDPPYNTTSDEFVYPDKFDKEEAEVLGLANLSENDFARMEFSFKSKKSHNGWLSFMYPRLLLARDLLSQDGVIFISIDDNEQANLKLLCDEIFGEENFIADLIWKNKKGGGNDSKFIAVENEHVLFYAKSIMKLSNLFHNYSDEYLKRYKEEDAEGLFFWDSFKRKSGKQYYKVECPDGSILEKDEYGNPISWLRSEKTFKYDLRLGEIRIVKITDQWSVQFKQRLPKGKKPRSIIDSYGTTSDGSEELLNFFEKHLFDNPKPTNLIKHLCDIVSEKDDIILDFFAGSGTTGHAVMQLNADDGGNRKFILCQIDEPIKKGKPAYQFCIDHNLPPVISSITIERLKRAGKKISEAIKAENEKNAMFEDKQKTLPDICYKVFDSIAAPKLELDETTKQVTMKLNANDALSRIYNMIFTLGLDEPTQTPEEVVQDCIYKIGKHYYVTNSVQITPEQLSNAIKNGKVFIDGWTASLNSTLQNYKEDVKIVF
jgi:adenine-specific DNA-methyltransferase